jgi:hypothetical protein
MNSPILNARSGGRWLFHTPDRAFRDSDLPLMPSTACRSSLNLTGPPPWAMPLMAVHWFAILAKEVRDGHVATMTFQTAAFTESGSLVTLK